MLIDDIAYDAEKNYEMEFIGCYNGIILFRYINHKSKLNEFMKKWNAKRFYCSHTEDELYGIEIY